MNKRFIIWLVVICIFATCLTACGGEKRRVVQPDAPTVTAEETPETTAPPEGEETTQDAGDLGGDKALRAEESLVIDPMEGEEKLEGIRVISGKAWKLGPGALNYTPGSDDGYFAVNGVPIANTQIVFSIDGSGMLNYKLSLNVDRDRQVKAKISATKNGTELVTYERNDVMLKAGACELDACVDTKEEAACSGRYTVRVWLDDVLVIETVDEL